MPSIHHDESQDSSPADAAEAAKAQIDGILGLAGGEKINICYVILVLLDSLDEDVQPVALRYACESFGSSESSEEHQTDDYISKNELKSLTLKYGSILNQLLEMAISEDLSEDEFYGKLWSIVNNPLLSEFNARVFALYWYLIDKRIPYFNLGSGLKMSNEDYKAARRRLRFNSAKIRFIMSREFTQRTEQASLLLDEIDSHTGVDRVILMTEITNQVRSSRKFEKLSSALSMMSAGSASSLIDDIMS